jgi:hypothetical protein
MRRHWHPSSARPYPGNEDKFEGYELGGEELALKDSDGGLAFPVAGVLYGDADLDWYKFYGWDSKDAFSLVDPSVTLTVGDSSIKLALFVECAETDLKHLTCATDAVSVTDESGRDGCESTVSVALKLDEAAPLAAGSYNCDTTADSSYVWFRVRSESTEQCLPYQLEVHF